MNKKIRVLSSIIIFSIFMVLLVGSGENSGSASSSGSSSSGSTASVSTSQSSTASTEAKKPQTKDFYKVGEAASVDGVSVTVTKVEKSNGSDFDKPKDGMEFVIVNVQIKNGSKDKITYNPFDFKVQNSKGQITDETFSTANTDTALQSGELAPNGSVQGSIVFEEPVNDSALVLQYQENIFTDKVKLQFKLN